jgi:hypothetical protein
MTWSNGLSVKWCWKKQCSLNWLFGQKTFGQKSFGRIIFDSSEPLTCEKFIIWVIWTKIIPQKVIRSNVIWRKLYLPGRSFDHFQKELISPSFFKPKNSKTIFSVKNTHIPFLKNDYWRKLRSNYFTVKQICQLNEWIW